MADDLCRDMAPMLDTPVRMMYLFFERDRFRPSPGRTDCGCRLLRGMLDTLPDNKIVEDMHNALRRDSRANANTVLSTEHVQQIITQSRALELRDIAHPCSVPKEVFVRRFRSTSGQACGRKHRGWKHQLPKNWTRILGRRTWTAISEETLKTAMAAWEWLQNGFQPQSLAPREGVEKLQLALLSCVLERDMLVQHVPTGCVQVCLGSAKWAALTWPMHALPATEPGNVVCYKLSEQGPARFVHVTDLSLWRAIPYEPARIPVGVVLRQVGPPQPLLRARLADPRTLTYASLVLIAKVEGLQRRHDRRQQLETLAASQGDNAFVQQVLEEDGRPRKKAAQQLADDEVCEAALEGMDPDDRQDFAEVGEAVRRGRARRRGRVWAQRRQAPLRYVRKCVSHPPPRGEIRSSCWPRDIRPNFQESFLFGWMGGTRNFQHVPSNIQQVVLEIIRMTFSSPTSSPREPKISRSIQSTIRIQRMFWRFWPSGHDHGGFPSRVSPRFCFLLQVWIRAGSTTQAEANRISGCPWRCWPARRSTR